MPFAFRPTAFYIVDAFFHLGNSFELLLESVCYDEVVGLSASIGYCIHNNFISCRIYYIKILRKKEM